MKRMLFMFVMLFAFSSAGYAQISDPVQSEIVGPVTMPVLDDATDHAVMVSERPFTVTGENAPTIKNDTGYDAFCRTGSADIPALVSFEVGWPDGSG
jgi:hypothetical protein